MLTRLAFFLTLGLSAATWAVAAPPGVPPSTEAPAAKPKDKPSAVAPALTDLPRRIVLGWTGDPAHTMSVTWRTKGPSPAAKGQVATFKADPAELKPLSEPAATYSQADLGGGKSAHQHRVTFQGLSPDTSYWYRVGEGDSWSEWTTFRTASDKPEPFKFIYFGDAQNSIRSLWTRTVQQAFLAAPDARFMVHAGDLVAEGWDDALWGEWVQGQGFVASRIPSLPCPGNHDEHLPKDAPAGAGPSTVHPIWHGMFTLPQNGPKDAPELVDGAWYLDYQGVRFISLDANPYTEEAFDAAVKSRIAAKQVQWLEGVLGSNPNRWTIVIHHQPLYSAGKDRDYPELRAALLPLYDKYHVDLVLQGHDHIYGRTRKLAGGKTVGDGQPGTVYAISVSGPKAYELNPMNVALMAITRLHTQMYQVITVAPDRLDFEAFSITGEPVDRFELRKSKAGASTLVDQHQRSLAAAR
jgi:hypothetical protein